MSFPGSKGYVRQGPLKKAKLNTNKMKTPWVEPATSGMTSGGYQEGGKGICVDVPPGDTKLVQALAANNLAVPRDKGQDENKRILEAVKDVIRSPAKVAQFFAYTEWYLHQKRALQYFQPTIGAVLPAHPWPQYRYASQYSPVLWQLDPIPPGDGTSERAGQKVTLSHIELVITLDAKQMTGHSMAQARLVIFQWMPTLTAAPAVDSVLAGAPAPGGALPDYWLALCNHEKRRQYHVLYDQTWILYSPVSAGSVGNASAQVMMHEKPVLANFATPVRMYNQSDPTNLQGTGSLWALLLDSNPGSGTPTPAPGATTNVQAQIYHRIYYINE